MLLNNIYSIITFLSLIIFLYSIGCKKMPDEPPLEESKGLENGALLVLTKDHNDLIVVDRFSLEQLIEPIPTGRHPSCILVDEEKGLIYSKLFGQ
jgi:hypothetical protein